MHQLQAQGVLELGETKRSLLEKYDPKPHKIARFNTLTLHCFMQYLIMYLTHVSGRVYYALVIVWFQNVTRFLVGRKNIHIMGVIGICSN